jgi:outer membrane protein OmpA-like peptidoglycan-associated protein
MFILLFIISLLLSGCYSSCAEQGCPALSPGYCIIYRHMCCLDRDPALLRRLACQGVQVERMGDQVLLILPTDLFFHKQSTHLDMSSCLILDDVITLLNCFEKIQIKVAGYTDNSCCLDENIGLSKQQATNLVSYMWQHGLDARLVYPVGYGEVCPITSNKTAAGRKKNRRIEITLTHLPPRVYE